MRRRLLWSALVIVALLLLIFLPPLISVSRYRRQIASSMSQSMGRPVHLDDVSLHLLPVPGLTLTNLVVSEDPAFGFEPTIRANSVEATLRLGSLWRRRVEFSSVRFVEPSVNLVRNQAGRWNLANVLLQASHVNTAPTDQRRAGPAPRFPYIEATGGRVNIKLGSEKLPYSLTGSDFALWLPSSGHWRVRLQGLPARTDTNITDPGLLRIQGDLQQASRSEDVPVSLQASWHDAPAGEATHLLVGNDLDWRGVVNVDASLMGTLSAAQIASKITLGGLRRASFAPAHPMNLQVTCASGLSIATVTLKDLRCTLPSGGPEPITLGAAELNLQHPREAVATLSGDKIPMNWALLWAALFSPRVPTDLRPGGTVDLHFQHTAQGAPAVLAPAQPVSRHHTRMRPGRETAFLPAISSVDGWTGTVQVELPSPAPAGPAAVAAEAGPGYTLLWRLAPGTPQPGLPGDADTSVLRLQPVAIRLAPQTAVTVSAVLSGSGYSLNVIGSADTQALLLPARYLPQLGDGLDSVLPEPPDPSALARVDFECVRTWGAAQSCTALRPTVTTGRPAVPASVGVGASLSPTSASPRRINTTPSLLQPRSLSPLDSAPRLGGTGSGQTAPSPAGTPPQP